MNTSKQPPTSSRPSRKASAFTLIELLMVVSIIALLIAIMMPALGKARTTSKRTSCGATLKGMTTAFHIMLAANDNTVPWNGIVVPKPGGGNQAPTTGYGHGEPNIDKWDLPYGALWSYMGENPKAYMCGEDNRVRNGFGDLIPLQRNPSIPTVVNGAPATGAISVARGPNGYWSYSVNSVLNSEGRFRENFQPRKASANTLQPWIDPIKWTNVVRSADFYVFIEEDINSPFNDEVFDAPAYNGGDKLTDRHMMNGAPGGNVGFADGHVEWISDVVFNNAPPAGNGPTADHWAAMQYPITRNFFLDGGNFATPP
jgi:prepilin-type N-terminal cleavage/methylation domain-containing protein/prepilin-type processing-associated H-X9-DG protein